MKDIFKVEKNNIAQHKWSLKYNPESHKAKLIDEQGKPMDLSTLNYSLEALGNEVYDLKEKNYRSQQTTPLDDLSKRRQGVVEYKLISDSVKASRDILEAYGDDYGVFTIDQIKVYENRRINDEGSPIYLNYSEAKELMHTLQDYINRVKHLHED